MSDAGDTDRGDIDSILPYSSLPASVVRMEGMRAGKYLVGAAETVLPARCIICNEPSSLPLQKIRITADSFRYPGPMKSFRYHSTPRLLDDPATLVLHACFCTRHLNRRRKGFAIAAAFAFLAVLAGGGAASLRIMNQYALQDPPMTWILWWFALSMLLGVGAAMAVATRGLAYHHSRGGYSYFTGVGRDFLRSLPECPSAPDSLRG